MINANQNQTFRIIGVDYLKKLTLTQRIIRILYLKYVQKQEQAAFQEEIESTTLVMINEESRLESAMIEKQWYEKHYPLH